MTFTTFNAFPNRSKIIIGFPNIWFDLTTYSASIDDAGYDLSIDGYNITLVRNGGEVPTEDLPISGIFDNTKCHYNAPGGTFTIRTLTSPDNILIHPMISRRTCNTSTRAQKQLRLHQRQLRLHQRQLRLHHRQLRLHQLTTTAASPATTAASFHNYGCITGNYGCINDNYGCTFSTTTTRI